MDDMHGKAVKVGDHVYYRGSSAWPRSPSKLPVIAFGSSTTLIVVAPGQRYVRTKNGVAEYEDVPAMQHCVLASLCEKAEA